MTTIQCSKEAELSEMGNDIKWIRAELEGNGKEGLVRKVTKNTQHRIEADTRNKIARFAIGSGWLFSTISMVVLAIMLVK